MPSSDPADALFPPGAGETITELERRQVVLLAEREEISITSSRYAGGERGPSPHVHREHTDAFYVLDGELAFSLGPDGERVVVPAGGFVAVPPNLIHSFVNEDSAEARFLNFHAPDGGFAGFLRALRDRREAAFDSFDPPVDGGIDVADAVLAGPGEGERLVSGNRVAFLKGALPQLSFFEFHIDGTLGGPDLHHHERQVDSFYVLEGEIDFVVEDAVHTAGPGTLASIPSGVRHTFSHMRPGKARLLNLHAPDDGFADFLRRVSARPPLSAP